ncbi:MAG: hypothetical protein JW953_10460 [Anaerolineae bacterium]|nr:hypothetical protein [Anaerolineae bacterium]
MTEKNQTQSPANEAWQNVGRQFRSLGESLAAAFKTTWESEETRQHLEEMQTGLEKMANEIGQAVKEAAESEEGQKIKVEAEKAAQSAQAVGRETMDEMRPHLLNAFRKIRTELDQIITGMEQKKASPETPEVESNE